MSVAPACAEGPSPRPSLLLACHSRVWGPPSHQCGFYSLLQTPSRGKSPHRNSGLTVGLACERPLAQPGAGFMARSPFAQEDTALKEPQPESPKPQAQVAPGLLGSLRALSKSWLPSGLDCSSLSQPGAPIPAGHKYQTCPRHPPTNRKLQASDNGPPSPMAPLLGRLPCLSSQASLQPSDHQPGNRSEMLGAPSCQSSGDVRGRQLPELSGGRPDLALTSARSALGYCSLPDALACLTPPLEDICPAGRQLPHRLKP